MLRLCDKINQSDASLPAPPEHSIMVVLGLFCGFSGSAGVCGELLYYRFHRNFPEQRSLMIAHGMEYVLGEVRGESLWYLQARNNAKTDDQCLIWIYRHIHRRWVTWACDGCRSCGESGPGIKENMETLEANKREAILEAQARGAIELSSKSKDS